MSKKKTPEVIEDADLDKASGGIGLLLPAVQKVADASSTSTGQVATHTGGVNVALADGSVRNLKAGIDTKS